MHALSTWESEFQTNRRAAAHGELPWKSSCLSVTSQDPKSNQIQLLGGSSHLGYSGKLT